MTDTHEPAGLIGAIRRGVGGTLASINDHDSWAIRLVFFAGIITILQKAGLPVPMYGVLFAVALGVAALLYEMNATKKALRNFWTGNAFSAMGWAIVWVVAFAYSMNQWLGAASENEGRKSNIHNAAFTKTQSTDDALKEAKKELDRVTSRLSWMDAAVNGKPVRSVDAADADLENAKAHKLWKSTDGCKDAGNKSERKFCDNVAALRAEKSLASEAAVLKSELPTAKAAYAKAMTAQAETPRETSEARNDLFILTDWMGVSEKTAGRINSLGAIMAISIFLSLATMLRELEHLRSMGDRKPLFSIRKISDWFYELMTGKTLVRTNNYTILSDAKTEATRILQARAA